MRCRVINISDDGAAIEVPDPTCVPNQFRLMTEGDRIIRECRIAWIVDNRIGLEFEAVDHDNCDAKPYSAKTTDTVTHPQRQFMQYLRNGEWILAISLPDKPKVVARLLSNGWIERQGLGSGAAYRLTAVGLTAKCSPVQIYRKVVALDRK